MSRTNRLSTPKGRAISHGLKRYQARKRAIAEAIGRGLKLIEIGIVRDEVRPFVDAAAADLVDLVEAAGGPERLSPARRLLLEQAVSLLLGLRGERARYAATGAADALDRMSTLANSVRSLLVAAGLDPVVGEDDPLDVREYRRAAREASAGSTIDTAPDAEPESVGEVRRDNDLAPERPPLDGAEHGGAGNSSAPAAVAPSLTDGGPIDG